MHFCGVRNRSGTVHCTPKMRESSEVLVIHHLICSPSVHSIKQNMTVQNLSPNTRYEFVVRLHLDQVSSPWSSVVYHRTPAAGKVLDMKNQELRPSRISLGMNNVLSYILCYLIILLYVASIL